MTMQYKALKLFRPTNSLIIPPAGYDGKNVSWMFFGENLSFLEAYPLLKIKPQYIRNVFVPTIVRPIRSYLTPEYKRDLMSYKLRPFKGYIGDYTLMEGKNFYLDYSTHMNILINKFKLKRFDNTQSLKRLNPLIESFSSVPSESFERSVLYAVSLDKPIATKVFQKKLFMLYRMIVMWFKDKNSVKLPFDKVVMFLYDSTNEGKYVLIFDKNSKLNNVSRLRSILFGLKSLDDKKQQINIVDTIADEAVETTDLIDKDAEHKKITIKHTIQNYLNAHPQDIIASKPTEQHSKEYLNNIVRTSVLYHAVGDLGRARTISNRMATMPVETQKSTVDKFNTYVIPKSPVTPVSHDPWIKKAQPDVLVDHQNPKHIFDKRKSDFKESLVNDMIDSFKVLESKNIPLRVHKFDVKTVLTSPSELNPTLKDRYNITLKDNDGQNHNVTVELPHLTENGTFTINGQPKVLINQIIVYPIFFFKPYAGKFTSSYSSLTISSKILRKASYLMLYMVGYKVPLILYLGYRLGFDNAMKFFNIPYSIVDKKQEKSIALPNQTYLVANPTDEAGVQLVESLNYCLSSFDKKGFDINNQKVWRTALENFIGNRNCTYLLDQVWNNIVTPTEIKILQSKGDPYKIDEIVRYISREVVTGRVDDRNSLDKQRIRTSEVFVALLQKQVQAAYTEYESKKLAGDKEARLFINPTKTFSEVTNSQNVQMMENINPLEELSVMTRITPVGIGGVPDKEAFPERAMNLHDTYYGNIDPLETPDGPGVGIQQQLSIGASLSNTRGMFAEKDRANINPSEILSTGPSMIPFVESNDGCRVTMASGQAKQAIPLDKPEIPAIQSGYESILVPLLSDSFIKKSPVEGVVTEISPLIIKVQDTVTGKIHSIDTKPLILKSGQGKPGLGRFKSVVTVGQKLEKDQIVAEGSNITDGMITNGVNMLSAFMPWKGYNFEDGMVISESAAKKFVSLHVEEYRVYLSPDEDVEHMVKYGDKLSKGGVLMSYSTAIHDVESMKHLRCEGGQVVNIEIFSNVEETELPEKLIPEYNAFKEKFIALKGVYPAGSFKEKGEKIEGILIKFTVQQSLKLMKGDKLNNRHFNKGVVAIIEKDENMPVTPWGEKVDMIYNPLSVINRMNTGQILELHTSMISKNLATLIVEKDRSEFTTTLQATLNLLDGTKDKQYSKNLLTYIKSASPLEYSKLVERAKRDKFIPLIFPPFKTPPRKNILQAMKYLGIKPRYSLYLPEYKMNCDPVSIGYIYVMKLEHISEKKIQARSIGPYVSKTMAPTGGKSRDGGQQLGEYDAYSLMAWDAPILIDEFFGPASSDHVTKNEMISEIIQTGETSFKATKTNPVKELYANMMIAIHLEAE